MKNLNVKTLFLFRKKKTCAKRKNNIFFGKAFFLKERFIGSIGILDLFGSIGIYWDLGFPKSYANTGGGW